MKFWTIALKQLSAGKLAWIAALLVGLCGAALPYVEPIPGLLGADAHTVMAVGLQLGYILALCAVLGFTMVPADLANRRLSFYLARPVGIGSLWAGRFLGAWLLTVSGCILVGLPEALLHPAHFATLAAATLAGAILAIPVLFAGHILGVIWYARTPWVLLDLAAVAIFMKLMGVLFVRLLSLGAWAAVPWFLSLTTVLFTTALMVATHFQLALGRADLSRGHRVMALAMACALGCVLLGTGLFTAWATSGGPDSLTTFRVLGIAPKGDWLTLQGAGRFGPRTFLLNARTGAYQTAPFNGHFTADGNHFVGVLDAEDSTQVLDLDLTTARTRVVFRTGSPLGGPRSATALVRALSPDGRIAVVMSGRQYLLVDLATPGRIREGRLQEGSANLRFAFPTPQAFRVYQPAPDGTVTIREQDLTTGVWADLGHLPRGANFSVDPTGKLALVADGEGHLLCEGATGTLIRRIAPSPGSKFGALPRWCGNGLLAAVEISPDHAALRLLDAQGQTVWLLELPAITGATPIPEVGTSRIFLNVLEPSPAREAGTTSRVLIADGAVRTLSTLPGEAQLALPFSYQDRSGPLATRLLVPGAGGLTLRAPDGTTRAVLTKARAIAKG